LTAREQTLFTALHGWERASPEALMAVLFNEGRAALECRAPSKECPMRAEAVAMVSEIEESLELLRRRL
jgi:hypothetical protein